MKSHSKPLGSQFISWGISLLLCIMGLTLIPDKDDERINEAMCVRMPIYIWHK